MAVLAIILSLFKEKQMRTYRKTRKSYNANSQAKQVCQTCTRNIKLLKFDSDEERSVTISNGVTSICSDSHQSIDKFDKAAHEAMLEMLSIEVSYYDQVSTSIELT